MKAGKNKYNYFLRIRCLAFVLMCLCGPFSSFSQEANTFSLKVKFSIQGGGMENALITITKNGTPYRVIDSKAKYKLDLELGAEFLLVFTKPGYITKSIAVDTRVPNGREKEEIREYIATVELAKQPEDQEITYTQPVGRIKYSTMESEFDADKDYTQAAQAMVAKAEANPKPKPKPPAPNPKPVTTTPPPQTLPPSNPIPVAVKPPEYKPEPPKPKPVAKEPETVYKPVTKNKVEKVIQEDRKKITVVTVTIDGIDYVYKKEEYNWGGVYFYCDGKNITENTFTKQTE
ncbi:MAG: hypothetical protein K0Q95_2884 [Bacteroidota bacterium]|jgi:hypothetical protein|nr:hypothetical protein [Bacteroidota bacterium]